MDYAQLSAATAALVGRDDSEWLYDALMAVTRLQVNYPVALIGLAACVDPLRELARDKPDALTRIFALVDAKRVGLGKKPLIPTPDARFDKTEYMRDFMDKKRQRLRRAVGVENFLRPDRDASGGTLSKDALDTIRARFWTWADEQLDEAAAEARRKL